MTLYTDVDPFVCEWVRELVRQGLVSKGDVLCKSIKDLSGEELRPYTRVHLFCGIAGWDYALNLAGWPDDRPVWTGSCPCQPFSFAGQQRGTNDDRHLWPFLFDLIRSQVPPVFFGEQVGGAIGHGWLDGVASDLEGAGYFFGASVLSASAINAPHRRDRIWFVADAKRNEQSREEPRCGATGRMGREQQLLPWDGGWPAALARFRVVDDGLPRCVAGTDAARNAIVPQVAAEFIRAYMECES